MYGNIGEICNMVNEMNVLALHAFILICAVYPNLSGNNYSKQLYFRLNCNYY